MSELGPKARALFAAARDGDDPTDADRERVEKALFAAIAAGATTAAITGTNTAANAASAGSSGASAGGGAGAVGTAATVTTGGLGALKIVVALVLLGGAGTGALWAAGTFEEPAATPSSSVTPSPAAARETSLVATTAMEPALAAEVSGGPETEATDPPQPAEAASAGAASAEEPEIRRRAPHASGPSAIGTAIEEATDPGGEIDPLILELGLLRDANRALRGGRPIEALRFLEEHGRRFPDGTMVTEREAARAVALCDAGRRTEGQRAAQAFIEGYPGSPLVARVREACELR